MSKSHNIVLLGPPGSGKGTQAKMLADKYKIPHISIGEILRDNIRAETELGLEARSYIEKGELIPDGVLVGVIRERLLQPDCTSGFLLDGYPRTLLQADELGRILSERGNKLDAVLYIDIHDEAELMKRLAGRRMCTCNASYHLQFNPPKREGICDHCGRKLYQRDDDREDAIKTRLEVYKQQTQPLVAYYAEKSILLTVDGAGDILEVFNRICRLFESSYY